MLKFELVEIEKRVIPEDLKVILRFFHNMDKGTADYLNQQLHNCGDNLVWVPVRENENAEI